MFKLLGSQPELVEGRFVYSNEIDKLLMTCIVKLLPLN